MASVSAPIPDNKPGRGQTSLLPYHQIVCPPAVLVKRNRPNFAIMYDVMPQHKGLDSVQLILPAIVGDRLIQEASESDEVN